MSACCHSGARPGPYMGSGSTHLTMRHMWVQKNAFRVHRNRFVVDCGDTGMDVDLKLLVAARHMYDPTVSPCATEGSHSDEPAESPSEPASPPHSDDMGSAGLARGVGVAADSGLPEGVGLMGANEGLDEGVAPGSWGAEAAPAGGFELPEVGQFLRTPTEV